MSPNGEAPKPAGCPGSMIPSLAPATAELRRQVLGVGAMLAAEVEAEQGRSVRQAVDYVRNYMPSIAIIGQMKAGKSSFASALIGRPWLLPTNVNPWTAVVTRLHFGHPNGRTNGASYEFFSDEEWRHLTEDAGRLRGIASRLLPPGFDMDIFRAQLTEVRARAQRRLGPDFARLLNTTHSFSTVSTEQIARYVTAGDASAAPDGQKFFSDVTRSADIFFDTGPFGLPLTVIDTPGTNDPFLVRDEITLRCIEDVMLAVVVMSVRQALTTSDMALLRTLGGINKDRLVVFINRCDELDDVVADGERIRSHVSRNLEREFGRPIPVICGSALWGNFALAPNSRDLAKMLDNSLMRAAVVNGGARREELEAWKAAPQSAPLDRVSRAVLAASGIPALREHLSRQLDQGAYGEWVRRIHGHVCDVSSEQEDILRHQLQSLEESVRRVHFDVMTASLEAQRLKEAASRLDSASAKLERITAERMAQIAEVQRQGIERLRRTLREQIDSYIERERAGFMRMLDEQLVAGKPLRIDVSRLRSELEQAFLKEYRALYAQVRQVQSDAVQSFRRIISDEMPRSEIELRVEAVTGSFVYPNIAGLGRVTAFDVDPKLWSRWRKTQKSLSAAVDAFEVIVREEFRAVADLLAEAADRDISGPASLLRHKLDHSLFQAMRAVRLRNADVTAMLERLTTAKPGDTMLGQQLENLASARQRLADLQRLTKSLYDSREATPAQRSHASEAV